MLVDTPKSCLLCHYEGVTGACRQVIMIDRHTAGPLDGLWSAVAAGAGSAALNTSIDGMPSGAAAM